MSRAARFLLPILAHVVALPITLVSMFAVEIAAVLLVLACWFIAAVLFSTGAPL